MRPDVRKNSPPNGRRPLGPRDNDPPGLAFGRAAVYVQNVISVFLRPGYVCPSGWSELGGLPVFGETGGLGAA